VPLRYQFTAAECGAACLAMVASSFGRHTSVSECRELLGLGRDGASAKRLADAAASIGIRATAERCDDPFARALDGPVIAYYARHHVVVVERLGRRYVRLADPAGGRQLLTREEFRERYGGVLIRLAPTPEFACPLRSPDPAAQPAAAGPAWSRRPAADPTVRRPPAAAAAAVLPAAGPWGPAAAAGQRVDDPRAAHQQVLTLLLDAALLSGYVIGLAVWTPAYVPVVLCLGAAQAVVLAGSYRRIKVLARRELQAKAEEQNYLVEVLEAAAPLKANGIEPHARAHWQDLFDTYRAAMLRRGRASSWVEAAQGGLSTLAPLTLLWFGLSLVLQGRLSLGAMLAANSLAMSVLAPLQAFVGAIQLFSILRVQVERIYDLLDAPAEETGKVVLAPRVPARVETSDLSFRYEAGGPAVLSGISFSLPPGAKLGIVGRTGSGKSTLALLLLGLLNASDGGISHNGVPIGLLDLAALRRGCGVVLQQLTLFNGTVHDNLTLGRTDLDPFEIEQAVRTAGLHEDLRSLPMGYQTIVGEAGAALSAGQRQRVALARAPLHRPRLLVLDEATSHLDPATERQIDQALSRLQTTRIVISHRLSAIRNADQILVLDRGRIIARGRHDQLIAEGGIYRELFGPPTSPRAQGPHHPTVYATTREGT
jgi:ABC-type bacteriocin/lantibiotic exporter with double-glycine peptidase domain